MQRLTLNFKIFILVMIGNTLLTQYVQAGNYEEGFESVNQLQTNGWIFDNRSDFIGDLFWSQGFPSIFTAHAGPDNSYILGGSGQTAGDILCDWLILPDLGYVDQINFFTRTVSNSPASDRLVVAYSSSGSTDTGPCLVNKPVRGSNDFGDFEVLHTVNPDLSPGGYPEQWTQVSVPVNGDGRLALVYFVENVSQSPFNGNLIAIDSINIGAGEPPVNPGQITPVPSLSLVSILILILLMTTHVFYLQIKKQR